MTVLKIDPHLWVRALNLSLEWVLNLKNIGSSLYLYSLDPNLCIPSFLLSRNHDRKYESLRTMFICSS